MIPLQLTSLNSMKQSKKLLLLENRLKLNSNSCLLVNTKMLKLEQAYIELQKKLGDNNEEVSDVSEDEVRVREEETAEEEVNPNLDILNKASEEFYANDGQVSAETLEELGKLDSNELISAYIELQGQGPEGQDLTEQQATDIKNMAGGDEGYAALTEWAANSLDESFITAYDNIVESGDMKMIQLALAGLQAEYERQNGFEGQMLDR